MNNYKDLLFEESFVDGKWQHEGQERIEVKNPVDLSVIGKVYDEGRPFVAKAIDAAHRAFPAWKAKSAKERSAILLAWYSLIQENKEAIATIMTLESGKPLGESRGEIDYGAGYIQWFAEEAKRNYGDVIPGFTADKRIMALKEPVGVVGAITPWNFPLAMITRKIAPALAVGCTVVVRPSESTPLTALAINYLAHQAGFPPGVINTVVGSNASELGKELCESKKVSKISFTGSTRVGQVLMAQCAPTLKKMSLELGGNAPFIVFDDADIDLAVKGAIAGKFRFGGQTCVCVNRILVQAGIYDAFAERFVKAVHALKMGNGLAEDVSIGPLINQNAVKRMGDMLADAVAKGGIVATGGHAKAPLFFEPTVLLNATSDMDFAQNEIFGPIAPLYKFETEEEAIQMANDTIYGLASYFYTNDLNRSWRVREQLEYGIVGINEGLVSSEVVPFGGVKYSGQGREGSKYGLDSYIDIKYVCVGNVR
ncbi:NAD-dependent succinate-semialdehyde dehydrogenase [Sphingobacterium psychroaquaticum]|uniref:Succinate-semialdehyde dehydrogenase / glutarate-semialdehyde dehydrogenase n=1 Tax=Sphingobacterium psychroaquaticum TaxID=561061 RepID=A0A1X7IK45_9SPHI|nr:NAD-dependent succinate-semialdehyde dehydrogenase [Sphingobacterium psychroaquaticum]QBQ41427.1 NAD-dependent succinate-semialdehyde dehydrogenase [Sphingobacterium psychroaquaticum]SMG15304.1 succinate-semialdehyde dehydrogenase / glutarate-semialdehyde dehydrogenase [Sphingobacterium psychroaquaticum]